MSDDLKYKIVTEGDISGAKKVQKALTELVDEAKKLDLKKLGGLAGTIAEFATFTAALEVAKKSVEKFAEAEQQVASLDAALAARAQLTDDYRESLQRLAGAQQEVTGITQGDWLKALTTLTQAGADPENIDKLVESTKNLAGIMGGDLQSAAFAIGKALNGSFSEFTRIGIAIDENAPKAEKLNQLWTQLAQRGGGQLEARSETIKGSFGKLKNATDDLMQGFGGMLAETFKLRSISEGLATSVNWVRRIFGETIPKAGDLKNALLATGAAMETAEEIAKRFAKVQENVKTATAEVVTQLQRETEALKNEIAQENNIAALKADVETKKVDAAEKAGLISPTEAALQRARIKKGLDDGKFNRENAAREKEKQMLDTTASGLISQGDEATQKAMEEKAKLDRMNQLADERAKLARKADRDVAIAQYAFDEAASNSHQYGEMPGFNRQKEEAAMTLAKAKNDRTRALKGFDQEHGSLDIASQTTIAKTAEASALETVKNVLMPKLDPINARREALDREQKSELRAHGYTSEADRLDAVSALEEARAKQRGEAKVGPDGSLEGSPAAVRVQQAANSLPHYQAGSAAEAALVKAYQARMAQLEKYLELAVETPGILRYQGQQINGALDDLAILKAWQRNAPNR